jgi:hypothetical protein
MWLEHRLDRRIDALRNVCYTERMKATGENIRVSGNEIDDIVMYPISAKFDDFLSEALCADIEQDHAFIGKMLVWSLVDWQEARRDYKPEDNVPREQRCFNAFINHGERLSAREASLILRYTNEEFAEERGGLDLLVPSSFARDIAIVSILHAANHIEKQSDIPVTDLSIHQEVQATPDAKSARQLWINAVYDPKVYKYQENLYMQELKRRESQEIAAESLANAYMLSDVYKIPLSAAVKQNLRINRSK